jgi:excisionase family DNA binding protein
VSAPTRNLGTIREAANRIGVTNGTVRSWILKRRIYAERIGTGRYLVDLGDIDAMRREYHPIEDPNNVADAPPLSEQQIHTLRTLLHATPEAVSDAT